MITGLEYNYHVLSHPISAIELPFQVGVGKTLIATAAIPQRQLAHDPHSRIFPQTATKVRLVMFGYSA